MWSSRWKARRTKSGPGRCLLEAYKGDRMVPFFLLNTVGTRYKQLSCHDVARCVRDVASAKSCAEGFPCMSLMASHLLSAGVFVSKPCGNGDVWLHQLRLRVCDRGSLVLGAPHVVVLGLVQLHVWCQVCFACLRHARLGRGRQCCSPRRGGAMLVSGPVWPPGVQRSPAVTRATAPALVQFSRGPSRPCR